MTEAEWTELGRYARWCADELGLRDWTVRVERIPADGDDTNAEVRCVYGRRIVRLRFKPDWRSEDPEEQRHNVIHELLHVHFDQVTDVITDDLARLKSISRTEYELICGTHRRAEEFATDAIADAIAKHFPLIEWPKADAAT